MSISRAKGLKQGNIFSLSLLRIRVKNASGKQTNSWTFEASEMLRRVDW